jgi:hypothetical protein
MDSQLLLLNKTNALIKPPLFSFFASSKPRYNPSSNFSLGIFSLEKFQFYLFFLVDVIVNLMGSFCLLLWLKGVS